MSTKETIFALATAPAKSGVAIIRISGACALPALIALTGKQDWPPNTAYYTTFSRNPNHEARITIDRGLAIFFASPKSFTGEDVAELHVHGSLAVIREMLETLAGMDGLRHAEPGEFSRRAFLGDKMDLLEAEGLADLIAAETPAQKKQALAHMSGEVSRIYQNMRAEIIHALALLEAYIDFPDEDIPATVLDDLQARIAGLKAQIQIALADNHRGERVRDGIHMVILGAPNAGKSSLLNALAGRPAAIVSERAGTTRDVIEIHMDLRGFPVVISDTAGIREATDDIEAEGVRRALAKSDQADIKLLVLDSTVENSDQARGLIDDKTLIIMNKIDLLPSPSTLHRSPSTFLISTKTGEGMDVLVGSIEERVSQLFSSQAAPLITRARHRALLSGALEALSRFSLSASLEIACEELRQASVFIGKITGKIAVDDILDVVFKQFCIGK